MKKLMARASFILLMAAALALLGMLPGMIPMPEQNGETDNISFVYAATSGDCGEVADTVSFEIDADGVMTISGTGKIKTQTRASNYPWYADRAKVKKIVLGEGVTNAPNNAFNSMTNLKDVELPSTLAEWGTNVFQSSSNIETITVAAGGSFSASNNILYGENEQRLILSAKNTAGRVELPSTLKTIDANGLDGRNNITELVLPDGLTTIGDYAFRNIKQVTSLEIPSTVTSIGANAFYGMESLTEMTIPDGITTLRNYIFSGCKNLTKVTLPQSVTSFGTYVFQNCTSLGELTIPSGVTSIGANAFAGASLLEELKLPDDLTSLGASAFSGCTALKKMVIPDGITALGTATSSSMFLNCTSLESVTLPEGLKIIGGSCFKGCTSLDEIDIPDTVDTIGALAFQQCTTLKSITVPEGVTELSGVFAGCTSLVSVDLPTTLTSLKQGGTGATAVGPFTGCESLEEISVPAGVTTIPKDTFNGCTSLTTLGLTDGVTNIGQNSYMNCTSLEEITIPATVTTVMGSAFENCTALTKVRLAEGMTEFNTSNRSATSAFKYCDRLTDVYIPDSLTGLNPITFEQAGSIQNIHVTNDAHFRVIDSVLYDEDVTKLVWIPASYSGKLVLPDTVVETGSRCAGFTYALTEIVFPEGFKTVGDSAFFYASGLRKVTLPSTLETIGASGFRATNLESIDIPDSVTSIGTNTFTLCENMKSAKIGSGIKAIPNMAFLNCYKLSDLTLPDTLESLGSQAFSGTKIAEIELPDGCKTVGATALANNTNLNQVTLPASITSIPSTAFNGDTGLKNIYFKGTADQWSALRCTPAYGSVITDYQGVDPDLEKAVIGVQPRSAVYGKGDVPEDLTVEVVPTDTAGEQYFYTWYKNDTGEAEGGTTVQGTQIENGSKCTPATDRIQTEYYYCVVTRMVNGYTAERTVSDVAAVTVKMDLEGSGSEADPFLIKNIEDLTILYNTVKEGNTLAGVFLKMTEDIELPSDWDPIGTLKEGATGSGQGKNTDPFSGTFDGGNHTLTVPEGGKPLFGYVRNAAIKNLKIYGTRIDGTGLIDHYERDYETGSSQSEFGSDANYIVTIENVTLKSGTKTRESGLIGENNNSQDASSMNPVLIVNCKAEEGVEIGYNHDESQIGTFAGRVCGTIINCESFADVYGTQRVGGIAGCQDVAMGILHVVNSSFHGTVTATGDLAGGMIGGGYKNGSAPNAKCVEIKNCYVDGVVQGNDMVGGIFGGENIVAQCWGNGIGYINNNLFAGTLKASEDAKYVGGTVGYYRSLNKYTNFENNYYKQGCGADAGIGGAQFVDTNAEHETESDITYFNTEFTVAGLPNVAGCSWVQGLNRKDDPFGSDKDKLSKGVSAEELADNGDVLKKLNEHGSGMHNWVMGEKGYPVLADEAVCYQLDLAGDYKTEYILEEEFDTTGMKFTASWTDGRTTHPSPDDITFEGFDGNARGEQTIRATFGAAFTEFKVKVLYKDTGEKIKVSLTMLGDSIHGGNGPDIHTNKAGTLDTWIDAEEVEVGINATCMDVLKEVLTAKGYKIIGTSSYVSGIKTPAGKTISEFTNGTYSGWMYTLNGEHSQLMLNEQYLADGDEIVFHYTDDYTFEEDYIDGTEVRELIDLIREIPEPEDLTWKDEDDIKKANATLSGLENDLDKLVPSALKAKLSEVTEAIVPIAKEHVKELQTELKEALVEYAEEKKYSPEVDPQEVDAAARNGRKAIMEAETKEDVQAAYDDAVAAIDKLVEDGAALAEAKSDATTEIRSYADEKKDLADADKVEIEAIKTENKIKDAKTKAEVEAALAEGESKIDDLVHAKEAEDDEAAIALRDAKIEAKAELDEVDAEAYAEPDEAAAVVSAGKEAIDAAKTPAEVKEALDGAKEELGKLKTKADADAETAAAELAAAKKAARAELNKIDTSLYAEPAKAASIISAAKDAVADAETKAEAEAAVADAKTELGKLKTKAEADEEAEADEAAAKEVADAKKAARAELNAVDTSLYAEPAKAASIISAAKDAVADAETKADAEAAVAAAKTELGKLKTKEQADAEEAEKAFQDAKKAALDALDAIKLDDYEGDDRTAMEKAIQDAKKAIADAKSVDDVIKAEDDFDKATAEVYTKEERADEQAKKDAEALDRAREDAIAAVKKYVGDNYNAMTAAGQNKAELTELLAILDIQSAKDQDAIEAAVKSVTDKVDALVIAKQKADAKKLKVKGLKAKSKGRRFTVTWKKNAKAEGYQVQYKQSKAKKFSNLKKAVKKVKVVSKKLKKGKKYIFRVRTYKTVAGKKVYGKWAKTKAVKCK